MMAQAAGDLGAVVRRWECDESMGKRRVKPPVSGTAASPAPA
jgi:hypothetical protein